MLLHIGVSSAQDRAELHVVFEGVRSSEGTIRAVLCADRETFMRGCVSATASASAEMGATSLSFVELEPGRYALAAWHDENDNGRVEIPQEGFAYGNNAAFPPEFDASSFDVSGIVNTRETFVYVLDTPMESAVGTEVTYASESAAIQVGEGGLVAEFYLPEGIDVPVPGVIALSGSDGDPHYARLLGRRLVDHGFALLSLSYWRAPGLPSSLEEIPLEYFHDAVDWLRDSDRIDAERIAVIGWSKGAEAALLIASQNAYIKAVVASSPSFVVWQGINFSDPSSIKSSWSNLGEPVPFLALDVARNDTGFMEAYNSAIATLSSNPAAIIPVERINGPILLLSGSDDRLWPAAEMAGRIELRLESMGFAHPVLHRSYEGAGHAVYVGGSTDPGGFAAMRGVFGGTPQADELAWKDSWEQVLSFFNEHLD